MKPLKLEKLKLHNILISPDLYSDGVQRTTVGWLQEFFLFHSEDEYTHLTDQDWQDYRQAVEEFKKLNNIGKYVLLENWEDDNTKTKQLEYFNKFVEYYNDRTDSKKKKKTKVQKEENT